MDLRDMAILALEEATQECRYGKVARTYALKLAMGYLWSLSGKERRPFDDMWKAFDSDEQFWRYQKAERALTDICRAVGVDHDHDQLMRVWKRVAQRHQ